MSNHCLNLNIFYSFFTVSADTLCLSFISAFLHQPFAEGETLEPTQYKWLIVLCSRRKHPLLFLSACLLLYSQSAGDWLQHWTMIRLCLQTHTAKIPQWGAMTTSLYNCHPGASVSILYVSRPHQQPVSPIGDLTQHPHSRDVTGMQLHSGTGCHVWDAVYDFPLNDVLTPTLHPENLQVLYAAIIGQIKACL